MCQERMKTDLECLLRQGFTIHPPLWLEDRFDHIARLTVCGDGEHRLRSGSTSLPANRDLHGIVLGINEEAIFLEGLDDSHPGMEPFHTL